MTKAKKAKQRPLQIQQRQGESESDALARTMLDPNVQAGATLSGLAFEPFSDAGFGELVKALENTTDEIKGGNLDGLEETLCAQATVLNAIFNRLAQGAVNNLGHYIDTVEIYMKLALRTQGQCRTTIESIAALKKPPPELIKQTNIAHGHQQVNNFPEKEKAPNELLEEKDGERLDTGTPPEAVRVDPDLATVGE